MFLMYPEMHSLPLAKDCQSRDRKRGYFKLLCLALHRAPQNTADALYNQLWVASPFPPYLSKLLEQLCDMFDENTYASGMINHSSSVFQPRDVALPHDITGQAYILHFLADMSFT